MKKGTMFVRLQRSDSFECVGTYGYMFLASENESECCLSLRTLEPSSPVIPVGVYDLKITHSPKFSRKYPYCLYRGVPLVANVPGHSGIRIHVGNYKSDTDGCILVGLSFNGVSLLDSVAAFRRMMDYLSDSSYDYKLVVGDNEKTSYDLYLDYCLSHRLESEYEKEEDLPF